MFKDKTSIADELASGMEKNLINNAATDENRELDRFEQAIDHLNAAAEIFDSVGLYKQAEYTTLLLESFAAKKKSKKPSKKKSKVKSKSKPSSKSKGTPESKVHDSEDTSNLTSERMVENLKHKGWVFNADDGAHGDHCECSMCMDMGYADDINDVEPMREWRLKKREGAGRGQEQYDVIAPDGEKAGTIWLEPNGRWGYDSIMGNGLKNSMEAALHRIKLDYMDMDTDGDLSEQLEDANDHFSTDEDASYEIDRNDIDDLFADDKIMDAARQLKEQGVFNHHENYGDFEDEDY